MVHRSPHPDIVVQNLSLYDMVFSAAQARGDAPAMADGEAQTQSACEPN